jgi:hypothetical protein
LKNEQVLRCRKRLLPKKSFFPQPEQAFLPKTQCNQADWQWFWLGNKELLLNRNLLLLGKRRFWLGRRRLLLNNNSFRLGNKELLFSQNLLLLGKRRF